MPKFVDCFTGSDGNGGDSWAEAWRTIDYAMMQSPTVGEIYVSAGIYTLEVSNKPQLYDRSPHFIGLGGVVFRSVGPAAAWSVPVRNYSTHSTAFSNIVFATEDILAVAALDRMHIMSFVNCDICNNAIRVVSPNSNTDWRFRFCSFGGSFPPAGYYTESAGPFKHVGTDFAFNNSVALSIRDNLVSGGMGFLRNTSAVEGANVTVPSAAQYDAGGMSFINGEALPLGICIRHDHSSNSIDRRKFSVWCIDPTGPAGQLSFIDNEAITLVRGDGVRALSPVFFYGRGISMTRIKTAALEFAFGGFNQVIDSTPGDSVRTLEYRISDTAFTQTSTGLPWQTLERDADYTPIVGKYLQFRVTFNIEAL
jgi:hypothetical protein